MAWIPARLARLPFDEHQRPIPWWVSQTTDGGRDYRYADPAKHVRALRFQLCWICGQRVGVWKAFLLSPAAVVAGVSSAAAQHTDCAVYAAVVCPYLATPAARRQIGAQAALSLGITVVVVTRAAQVTLAGGTGRVLLGTPDTLTWFVCGVRTGPEAVATWLDGKTAMLASAAESCSPQAAATLDSEMQACRRLLARRHRE